MAGVDGCPGGWIAAVLDEGMQVRWQELRSATELRGLADRICVDIPIGLPETGRRAFESEVRRRLGRRGSSVFPTPVRAVLTEAAPGGSYQRACELSREHCDGRAISRQTWWITDKIADVDAALAAWPGADEIVAEAHPELAFAMMNGGQALSRKKSAEGQAQRATLLRAWLDLSPADLEALLAQPEARTGGARSDDRLDALACTWTAQRWARGEAETFVDPAAATDATGRAMRIVC